MGKYFGTDGARGRANDTLTLDMAVKIGQYLGWYYGKNRHAKILIGRIHGFRAICLKWVWQLVPHPAEQVYICWESVRLLRFPI